jgi:putative ABC transport system substrate-binding protein
MHRRELITLLGGATTSSASLQNTSSVEGHMKRRKFNAPLGRTRTSMVRKTAAFQAILVLFGSMHAALAQQTPYRMGLVSPGSASSMAPRVEALKNGLREHGYVEGRNITIEYRWGEGEDQRVPGLVSDLMNLKVDMFLTHGVLATRAARNASATMPIVCFDCGDLVATGLVESLSRPGGNITGVTLIHPDTSGKRLELLKEMIPGVARVAVLYNPGNPVAEPELKSTQDAARILNLHLQPLGVEGPSAIERAVTSMMREGADALIVLSDAAFLGRRRQIAQLVEANRLPTIFWTGDYAKAGGLVGYGPDGVALARRAASYVDKILKGARPRDLPIEQPVKFELVVNLKAANALGLTISPALLARADEVIE